MTNLVPPHGSKHLKTLTMKGKELEAEKLKAGSLLKVYCSSREFGDVIMLGIGGFTPLDGFMNKDNWQSVCDNMVMTNSIFWPIPITLSSDDEAINVGDEISIVYEKNNEIIIKLDAASFNQQDFTYIQQLSEIIQDNGEVGSFQLGNLFIDIIQMNEYQNASP